MKMKTTQTLDAWRSGEKVVVHFVCQRRWLAVVVGVFPSYGGAFKCLSIDLFLVLQTGYLEFEQCGMLPGRERVW